MASFVIPASSFAYIFNLLAAGADGVDISSTNILLAPNICSFDVNIATLPAPVPVSAAAAVPESVIVANVCVPV